VQNSYRSKLKDPAKTACKSMILKGFSNSLRILWITLCVTRPECPQTLAAQGIEEDCPLSGHRPILNKINNLAQLDEICMLHRNSRRRATREVRFWG
jgi:hypothetical protein